MLSCISFRSVAPFFLYSKAFPRIKLEQSYFNKWCSSQELDLFFVLYQKSLLSED